MGSTGTEELWTVCEDAVYCDTRESLDQGEDCHDEWRPAEGDSGEDPGGEDPWGGGGGGGGGGDPGGGNGGGGGTSPPPDCSINTTFNTSGASVSAGASPTVPISSMPGVYGSTTPETMTISITACYDGTNWNAVLTSLSGTYAIQTRLLPGQAEITGIGGNTTASNFCDQLICLNYLGNNSGAAWYMISAVDAHEGVHATRMKPALEQIASSLESSIESLSVPYTGQTQAAAISQIRALSGFSSAVGTAINDWIAKLQVLVGDDHGPAGYATVAEQGITVPMASSICTHASANSWPTCGVCP